MGKSVGGCRRHWRGLFKDASRHGSGERMARTQPAGNKQEYVEVSFSEPKKTRETERRPGGGARTRNDDRIMLWVGNAHN